MKIYQLIFFVILLLRVGTVLAEQPPFVYSDHGKRDPFWPLVTSSGATVAYDSDFSPSEIVLEGIIADAKGADIGIINGRIVKVHDQVGPYTVTKIDKESVTLTKNQKNFELKLKKEE